MRKNITPCPFLACDKESEIYGWIEITNQCNLKCPYCYADSAIFKKIELSFDKIKEILKDLKSLGASVVMISGGEPSLRNDLVDILNFGSKKLGFKIILVSNGTALSPEIIKTLSENNVAIQLSIDSVNPKIYEQSRGVKLLPKIIKNIDLLLKSGVEIYLASTLTKTTRKSMRELIEFALEKGIQNVHIGEIIPEGRSRNNQEIFIKSAYSIYKELYKIQKENFLFISIDLIENFIYPIFFENKRKFYCNAMEGKTLEVGSDGQVYFCGGIRNLMENNDFNLNKNNLIDVHEGLKRTHKNFKISVEEIKECKKCKYAYVCSGGCRAIAYHHGGSLISKHPYCEDIKRIIGDIINDLKNGKLDDYKDFLLKNGGMKNKKIF